MTKNGKVSWVAEKRKLKDLIPWERNPRKIREEQAKRLLKSFDEFGQVETIAISPTNEIYNGHQRLKVLRDAFGDDYEVEVRISNRPLTEKEREKLTVYLHKGTTGEWDFDILANEFDTNDLLSWGFDKVDFGIHEGEEENIYTRNIEAPIYRPEGLIPPETNTLWDAEKTNELMDEINSAPITEDEKEFLRIAATRHIRFNYKLIADYYAHATQEMQHNIFTMRF